MIAPARTAAWRALRAVADGDTLPEALARKRERLADERDRALTAEIVTGTLRWLRSLDHLIAHVARRPLARLDPDILTILRLSTYQLLHLDRVPAAAVVDDAVSLARTARRSSASGFVNATLRTLLRERHRLLLPPRPVDPADREAALAYLGVTLSHPDWLVARWLDRYGLNAAEAWARFDNATPPLTLRVNTLLHTTDAVRAGLAAQQVEVESTRRAPDGLVVTAGNPIRTGARGRFLVQDEASQLVPLTLDAQPGETVLDLCAAPGGKTVALAAAMRDTGRLVACDVRPRRLSLLARTIAESEARCVRPIHVSRDAALPFRRVFDRVIVDAPCSGLGTIRRDPDIRWRRSEIDLLAFAAVQTALLDRAAEVIAAGGRLVYATCSSEPEENEGVVEAFLARHPTFSLLDLRRSTPAVPADVIDARGMLRTLPFMHGLEAFFAAAFVSS